MYIAIAAVIFGQAVLFASWGVALYGVVIVAAFDTFVRLYEEPTLRQAHGEEYAAYCAAVPRWVPDSRSGLSRRAVNRSGPTGKRAVDRPAGLGLDRCADSLSRRAARATGPGPEEH
jgi:hypothetical protein